MNVSAQFRERKERYYGKKVPGLSAFTNVWMPIICITAIWGLVTTAMDSPDQTLTLVLSVVYIVLAIVEALIVRGFDKASFWCTLLFLAIFLIRSIYSMVAILTATAAVGSAFNGVANEAGGVIGNAVAAGTSLGMGVVLIGQIIGFAVILTFVVYYAIVFIKHRDFFILSPKQLRARFEADD